MLLQRKRISDIIIYKIKLELEEKVRLKVRTVENFDRV